MTTKALNSKERTGQGLYSNRNFILLTIGQIVSNLGNSIQYTSMAWFVMSLVGEKNSGKYMGIFGMSSMITMIFMGSLAGVVVDRYDRKKIIVGTDILQGITVLIMAFMAYNNILSFNILIVFTVLVTFIGAFFNPAIMAVLPNIVKKEHLQKANSINSMVLQLSGIIGAAISGFFYYYLGITGIFLLNGISFILSGISEMFIEIPTKVEEKNRVKEKKHFWKDLKEGFGFIKNSPPIKVLLFIIIIVNFEFVPMFQVLLPKIVKFELNMTAKENGLLMSFITVGCLLGTTIMSKKELGEKLHKAIIKSIVSMSVFMALIGIPVYFYLSVGMGKEITIILIGMVFVLMGIMLSFSNITVVTVFHRNVPDEYSGRFWGILSMLTRLMGPVGLIVMGTLSDMIPASRVVVGLGIISVITGIMMNFSKSLKEV